MKIQHPKRNRGFMDGGILSGLVLIVAVVVVSAGIGVIYVIQNPPEASAPDGWSMMNQK